MILIHIKQSLNSEGKEYFPTWVKETRENLSKIDGFMEVYRGKMDDSDLEHLLIKFENKEKFIAWTQTENHKKNMAGLKPYHVKDPEMKILELFD